jgi:methanethiol S-methyltransferase
MAAFFFSILSYITGMSSLIYFFYLLQFGDTSVHVFDRHSFVLNILVFLIFPLQHSLLSRRFIKTRMSPHVHRPFYVLTSGIALWAVLLLWKPFGPTLYSGIAPLLFNILFYASLALIIGSTVSLGHMQMFGIYHGYAAWKQRPLPEGKLESKGLYGLVRHPITSLLFVALWSHESMTAGRLLLNTLFSIYSVVGTVFEERSLIKEFGKDYLEYRQRVPAFFPRLATILKQSKGSRAPRT